MEWLDRLKTISRTVAEKANLISSQPQDAEVSNEVSAFAPNQSRRWLPLAVMAGVVLIAIWFLASGGESEKDITHILQAKPPASGPPRDIRAKMKKKPEAKKAEAAPAPAADAPKKQGDDFFFKGDKKEGQDPEAIKKAEIEKEEGYDDLVNAIKAAAEKKK